VWLCVRVPRPHRPSLVVAADEEAAVAAPTLYVKFVVREVPRVEMLFKIIAAPRERFVDT
jgi:hypothetical protein